MTQTYYPFDAGAGANITESQWSAMAKYWRGTGVLPGVLNTLEVYGDSSGMQVKVKTGSAWIEGHYFNSDAIVTLAVAAADVTNPRIDNVVVRVDWTNNTIALAVLTGTPAGSPTIPAVTQSASIWEISLANVAVAAGASTVAAGNVTDKRSYSYAVDSDVDVVCGRLTLESGVAVSNTNQVNKTVLYWTTHNGNKISLNDGTRWKPYLFSELSLNMASATVSKLHDIFIYLNAGRPTMESLEWTNITTRATDLAFSDGIYVKSGDVTRRYVGTVYVDSGGKLQDTYTERCVWNYYNRTERLLYTYTPADSWSYTTAVWRIAYGGALYVHFVIGVSEDLVDGFVQASSQNASACQRYAGIALNANNTNHAIAMTFSAAGSNWIVPATARYLAMAPIGYNIMCWMEYSEATGSTVWIGDNVTATNGQSGMTGIVKG